MDKLDIITDALKSAVESALYDPGYHAGVYDCISILAVMDERHAEEILQAYLDKLAGKDGDA